MLCRTGKKQSWSWRWSSTKRQVIHQYNVWMRRSKSLKNYGVEEDYQERQHLAPRKISVFKVLYTLISPAHHYPLTGSPYNGDDYTPLIKVGTVFAQDVLTRLPASSPSHLEYFLHFFLTRCFVDFTGHRGWISVSSQQCRRRSFDRPIIVFDKWCESYKKIIQIIFVRCRVRTKW